MKAVRARIDSPLEEMDKFGKLDRSIRAHAPTRNVFRNGSYILSPISEIPRNHTGVLGPNRRSRGARSRTPESNVEKPDQFSTLSLPIALYPCYPQLGTNEGCLLYEALGNMKGRPCRTALRRSWREIRIGMPFRQG